MLVSGRVHPASYEKPAPTERTQEIIEAYQVGDLNEDDAVSTDKAGKVEVVGTRPRVLSKRFLLVFMTFLCFMSITTCVSTTVFHHHSLVKNQSKHVGPAAPHVFFRHVTKTPALGNHEFALHGMNFRFVLSMHYAENLFCALI